MKERIENLIVKGFFQASYRLGFAEWAIGAPQPELVRAVEGGALQVGARVLDVGCGAGDNAIFLAERGFEVTGIDSVGAAIRIAERSARGRKRRPRFSVGDALALDGLEETFDAILDSGLLHQFPAARRADYLAGLRCALEPGGRLLVHCFRQHGAAPALGPRRLSEAELRAAFAAGWELRWLRPSVFHSAARAPYPAWTALAVRSEA